MQLLRGSCFISVNLREFNTYLNKEILALHFFSQVVSKCNGAATPYAGMEAGRGHAAEAPTTSQTLHLPHVAEADQGKSSGVVIRSLVVWSEGSIPRRRATT